MAGPAARSRQPLSPAARFLVCAVGAAGLCTLVASVVAAARTPAPLEWIGFALLTFATGIFTLKMPSVNVLLSVSEVFAFSCVMLFGPELATITVAVDCLLLSYRARHSLAQTIFNFGNLTLSVWLSSQLFFALMGSEPMWTASAPPESPGWPLLVLASVYFGVNSGLTAAVISAESGESPFAVWRGHFMPLAPAYAAGASIAFLLVIALGQVSFTAVAVIPPVLLISYMTMRSSFGRLEDSKRHVEKLNQMYLSTIETLATAIDAKDEVTHGHIRRVQMAAVGLARAMGIADEPTIKAIEAAALLHDTGKIAVPEHILNKPGKLTPAEFEKMKLHAPIGAEILSSIDFPYPVVPIVRHHHENWDGSGYPDRLRGADIPIGARILSVVDCFDALTSDRPYRPRMSDDRALAILRERRGTMYDPDVVDAFVRVHRDVMPAESTQHPASRVVGGARTRRAEVEVVAVAEPGGSLPTELLALNSLSRAVNGRADASDIGALCWTILGPMLPASVAMAVHVAHESDDTLVGVFAAGAHAAALQHVRAVPGRGVIGWVAGNRRSVLNADPALDLGYEAPMLTPPLRATLAVPLITAGRVEAVLSVYAAEPGVYSEEHARVLEVMAPILAGVLASVDESRHERRLAAPVPSLRLVAPRQPPMPRVHVG